MKAANSKLSNYNLWVASSIREIADNAAVSYAISQAAQFLLSLLKLHVQCVQCVCAWQCWSYEYDYVVRLLNTACEEIYHIIIFICTA